MTAHNEFNLTAAQQRKLNEYLHKSLAFFSGELNAIEYINRGADIERPNADGHTPLMVAAQQGKTLALQRLIDAGARLDTIDNVGYNALAHAIIKGYHPQIDMLLKAGATLDVAQTVTIVTKTHQNTQHAHYNFATILSGLQRVARYSVKRTPFAPAKTRSPR